MKLCVPTSWDNRLIDELAQFREVYEVYGTLTSSLLGGGRPSLFLPEVDREKVKEHIEYAHSRGIRFNYLVNAISFGGKEYDPEFRRKMFEYLDWIDSLNADTITISHPYLIELVHKQYPSWEIKLGFFAKTNTVNKARYAEELGVKRITLPIELGRNVARLRDIRENTRCDLELIVNEGCIWDCPLMAHHSILTGYFSQDESKHLFVVDYPRIKCSLKKLDPEELIKVPWIRPEDRHLYEEFGVEYFKLAGRAHPTSWITRCVKAYSRGKYRGNLLELLDDPYLFMEEKFPFYLDNEKLEGFIDFFIAGNCTGLCEKCNYCAKFAKKAVKQNMTEKEISAYRDRLKTVMKTSLDRKLAGLPSLREKHHRKLQDLPPD